MRLSFSFLRLLVIILGMYTLYAGILYVLQRQILFPGQFMRGGQETPVGSRNFERLSVKVPDARSEVWFLPPRSSTDGPTPTVIVAHGNAELIDNLPRQLDQFREMGFALALVEYPGYGRSEGYPTRQTITNVFRAAYDRIADRADVDSSRVIVYGRSVGGGVACQLAADRSIAALILQSTFTRTTAFAKDFFLPGFLVRDRFDNVEILRSYSNPVLIIHGRRDRQIPFGHGEKLAEVAPNARLVSYDCGHNDCPPRWDLFWRDVSSFLQQHDLLDHR